MRAMERSLRTLGAAVAALLCLVVGARAGAAPPVAMNGHLPSEADCAAMEALGAQSVRMDFNWFQFEPSQDDMQWAHLDAAVASARAHRLAVYATVAYTPAWASSVAGCVQSGPDEATRCDNKLPADTADWVDAVTKVVARFQGQVECWGIWNEPNLGGFFQGSEDDFVARIFVPAASAIRAAKICGPELAGLTDSSQWNGDKGTCVFGACIRNGWERDLGELLDRVGSHLDVVTHHTYQSDAAGVMKAVLDGSSIAGILQHDSIRHVIDSHGGADKEFWLTETGWEQPPQGSTSESDVAARIVDLYAKQEEVCAGTYAASAVDPWRNWTRTYYFHFPYDPGSGWGIVNADGSPRPAYTALQGWASGRTTTACTGPGGTVVRPDAGAPAGPDAAEPPGPDAGEAPGLDAQTINRPDATTMAGPDASSVLPTPDGGPFDREDAAAAAVDASSAPGADASAPEVVSQGCGCGAASSAGPAAAAGMLLALSLGLGTRRWRRQPPRSSHSR